MLLARTGRCRRGNAGVRAGAGHRAVTGGLAARSLRLAQCVLVPVPVRGNALDCFPHHRGIAASMQGFFQMLVNACVAGIAVPVLHTPRHLFVIGQALFLSLAGAF
jgi:hypothetical protein